jgi:hypothetical protein
MDDWEDWDNDHHYCLPNEEQLKQLEERKLVEESDNALTKSLFEQHDLAYKELDKIVVPTLTEKKAPKGRGVSNKEANEKKLKEISKLTKEYKEKKKREKEMFGEATEDEYAEYEELFY